MEFDMALSISSLSFNIIRHTLIWKLLQYYKNIRIFRQISVSLHIKLQQFHLIKLNNQANGIYLRVENESTRL